MRSFLVGVFVLATTTAAAQTPEVFRVIPSSGFSYGPTEVTIEGNYLMQGFDTSPCRIEAPASCPIKVFFGDQQVQVRWALYDRIRVVVYASSPESYRFALELQGGVQLSAGQFEFAEVPDPPPGSVNYQRYMVPLRTQDIAGANGSLWRTELTVNNSSERQLHVLANTCDPRFITPPCVNGIFMSPGVSAQAYVSDQRADLEGTFVYVPLPLVNEVDLHMRVRDVSREAETLGTEIPIVKDEEFREIIRLLDVPTDPRYRSMLRIYGDRPYDEADVMVSVFPPTGTTPIEERVVRLAAPTYRPDGSGVLQDSDLFTIGAFFRLDPITDVVRASGHQRVRVQVRSLYVPRVDPGFYLPIWAFLSVTNNVTQQVTTIAPQRITVPSDF